MGIVYPASKVIVNDEVILDVTNTTATTTEVAKGFRIVSATGAEIEGTLYTQIFVCKICNDTLTEEEKADRDVDWFQTKDAAIAAIAERQDLILRDGDFLVFLEYFDWDLETEAILIGEPQRETRVYCAEVDIPTWITIANTSYDRGTITASNGRLHLTGITELEVSEEQDYIPYLTMVDNEKILRWTESTQIVEKLELIERFFHEHDQDENLIDTLNEIQIALETNEASIDEMADDLAQLSEDTLTSASNYVLDYDSGNKTITLSNPYLTDWSTSIPANQFTVTNASDDETIIIGSDAEDCQTIAVNIEKIDDLLGLDTIREDIETAEQQITDLTDGLGQANREIVNLKNSLDSISLLDDSIKLSGPYTLTQDFGYYTLGTASSKQFGTTGQSLRSFLAGAFAQEDKTIWASNSDKPSFGINISGAREGEIGSTVTPTAAWANSAGTYKWGIMNGTTPDYDTKLTGITYTSGTITATSGTLNSTLTYKAAGQTISVKGSSTRSAVKAHPISNIGNDLYNNLDTEYKTSKTNSNVTSSATFTGYRKMFMGATSSTATIDGALIRSLFNNSSTTGFKAQTLSNKVITAKSTDTKIIWAIPSSFNVNSIKFEYEPNKNDWKTLVSAGISNPLTITIPGAGSDEGEEYTVYVCAPVSGGAFGGGGLNTRITIS